MRLAALRRVKMARSVHCYVRGSTERFYEWLVSRDGRSAPSGPPIWICGDCHVGNLGPVAHTDGRVELEVRDLDTSVVGNPAHDVLRLALSLAMAVRSSNLSGEISLRVVEGVVRGYERALAGSRRVNRESPEGMETPLRYVLKRSLKRSWRHLSEERLGSGRARFPIGKRFWPLTDAERAAVDDLFAGEPARRLVTSLAVRDDDAAVKVLDAAYWVKGCSSLGRWRCAVLVATDGAAEGDATNGAVSLIDIKEAPPPCAPRARHAPMPRHNGERVVSGARSLSPFLGDRMIAATVADRPVFVRELLPQDLKLELETVSHAEAERVAEQLGAVVGAAHARQLPRAERRAWLASLRAQHAKTVDAPSWLWRATVGLVSAHEAAYLEHCRRHAIASP